MRLLGRGGRGAQPNPLAAAMRNVLPELGLASPPHLRPQQQQQQQEGAAGPAATPGGLRVGAGEGSGESSDALMKLYEQIADEGGPPLAQQESLPPPYPGTAYGTDGVTLAAAYGRGSHAQAPGHQAYQPQPHAYQQPQPNRQATVWGGPHGTQHAAAAGHGWGHQGGGGGGPSLPARAHAHAPPGNGAQGGWQGGVARQGAPPGRWGAGHAPPGAAHGGGGGGTAPRAAGQGGVLPTDAAVTLAAGSDADLQTCLDDLMSEVR